MRLSKSRYATREEATSAVMDAALTGRKIFVYTQQNNRRYKIILSNYWRSFYASTATDKDDFFYINASKAKIQGYAVPLRVEIDEALALIDYVYGGIFDG